MPRSPRIEFAGARYHVMSRGNRREFIFGDDEDKALFLDTLEECCGSRGWLIHAYVLMGNHFHLLLETPEPNLSDGMRWLQGTYGNRYNRRHGLVGHVWQGRFKSPLISDEGDEHFMAVSRYIHLNPAEAGLLDPEKPVLKRYPWSSFPALCSAPSRRPAWLYAETTMSVYELSGDTAENRKKYRQRMELACRECVRGELDEEGEAQRRTLLRGWYIGEKSFRNRMRNKLADAVEGRKKESLSGQAMKEYGTQRAMILIRGSMKYFGITLRELQARRYNDWQKQMLVALLRTQTGVSYDWIRAEIRMGSRSSVYEALKRVRNEKNRTNVMEWKQLCESMKTYH